jgi:hypothetical protein
LSFEELLHYLNCGTKEKFVKTQLDLPASVTDLEKDTEFSAKFGQESDNFTDNTRSVTWYCNFEIVSTIPFM